MYRHLVLSALVFVAVTGCGKDDAEPGDSSDTCCAGTPDPTFSATLSDAGVTLTITDGEGAYTFGIVNDAADGWKGEDCYQGQTIQATGQTVQYCHDAVNGENVYAKAAAPPEMDNTKTLFDTADEGLVTYMVTSETGACWVWGANPSYYDSFGCTAL